jgi:hypothetical protein
MVRDERGQSWSGDEDNLQWGRLPRLVLWGVSAALAVALAVIGSQTEGGMQRLAAAMTGLTQAAPARLAVPSAAQLAPPAFDAEGEARRLSEAVRQLTADRDRLAARVAALERSLEDVTGSFARRTDSSSDAAQTRASSSPFPPEPVTTTAPPTPTRTTIASRTASLPAIASGHIAPVEPGATRAEFGADIGTAPNMEGLRTLWSVVRTNYPQFFEGMRPVVAVRETRAGTVELRLIVGPLADAAASTRLCASLATAGLDCRMAVFEGQRLALR